MKPSAASIKAALLRLLRAVAAIYVFLFVMQRFFIFPAYMADWTLGKMKTPPEYGLSDFTETNLTTSDGVHITG